MPWAHGTPIDYKCILQVPILCHTSFITGQILSVISHPVEKHDSTSISSCARWLMQQEFNCAFTLALYQIYMLGPVTGHRLCINGRGAAA